jgi:ankyrin repeat protein
MCVLLLLLQNGCTPLLEAVKRENVEMVQLLFLNGAMTSINISDKVIL